MRDLTWKQRLSIFFSCTGIFLSFTGLYTRTLGFNIIALAIIGCGAVISFTNTDNTKEKEEDYVYRSGR